MKTQGQKSLRWRQLCVQGVARWPLWPGQIRVRQSGQGWGHEAGGGDSHGRQSCQRKRFTAGGKNPQAHASSLVLCRMRFKFSDSVCGLLNIVGLCLFQIH